MQEEDDEMEYSNNVNVYTKTVNISHLILLSLIFEFL